MGEASIRVLVVDDYDSWRKFSSTTLRKLPESRVVGEASDGLQAIQLAQQLQPDLIVLDIGLPQLNGIEAARKIRNLSPNSKILFLSENRSKDIAEEALSTGASGYVVKSSGATELFAAVQAVLKGKQFVSAMADLDQTHNRKKVAAPFRTETKIRHEVEFYADDAEFVNGFARFIEVGLRAGSAVIAIATQSHHANLLKRLVADGFDVTAEIKEGSYDPLEVTSILSSFMVDGSPDPVRFRKLAIDLITKAAEGAKGQNRRVLICGEGVNTLLAVGNSEATINLEHMWNEIAQPYELEILCAYFRSAFANEGNISALERIIAEHSASPERLGH